MNFSRSLITFIVVPGWILYANRTHLWFRRTLRWIVNGSQRLIVSAALFFIGVVISYEVTLMLAHPFGFIIHLGILTVCSIVYWAPLLLNCPFQKQRPYMQRLGYLALTSIAFFVYHIISFQYYQAEPTQGFLISGLVVMLFTLLKLINEWANAEKENDRITVEGYVRPISEKQ
ncbi:hypothetical protein Q7A53_14685 [Halobacillus rhizosphaerae]|uniref:hypothetical protein n=1 Tax=Halobacillus rhizosphaerae TaxID=3064889 RepID=UPI00398ACDFB